MFAKILVLVILLTILFNLGRGMYFLIHDKGEGTRTVKALSWRIGLSVCLFGLLFVLYAFGVISPHGIGG